MWRYIRSYVNNGMLVKSEESGDEEWHLDFSFPIDRVREALELLGIDTSEPLIAPPLGRDEEDVDDM